MHTGLMLWALSIAAVAPPEHIPGELIVTFRDGVTPAAQRATLAAGRHVELRRLTSRRERGPGARTVRIKVTPGRSLDEVMAGLAADPAVAAVQPNYIHRAFAPPDAEHFALQWALQNTGSNAPFDGIPGLQGPDPRVEDADIDALEAFDALALAGLTPEPVIVAVIDSGIDHLHEDLASVMWVNPGEVPGNGVDDDDNGFVDDVNGFDFVSDDDDPMDGAGHGTHCAGVIGALQDNVLGMCGVAGHIQLMALKGLSDQGSGSSFDLAQAILYAADNGAAVSNNSWGGPGLDPLIEDAVRTARDAGHLFIAAAGNDNVDMDRLPFGPAGSEIDNVVSVLATTAWKDRAAFSNFGRLGADLGAPGHEILSTVPGFDPGFGRPVPGPGFPNERYQIAFDPGGGFFVPWSGTSMAAPQVTGAAALTIGLGPVLFADWSTLTPVERMQRVRAHLLARTEPWPALTGLTGTGGHLNVASLVSLDITPPDPATDLALSVRGTSSVTLTATATGDDGLDGQATAWDVRVARGSSIDFERAEPSPFVWTPGPPGALDFLHVDGLSPGTTYTIAVAVLDEAGNRSGVSAPVTITTSPGIRLFADDVERGLNGWVATGGWAISAQAAQSPTRAWNDSPTGQYANNSGATLRSRRIGGIANRPLVLRWVQRVDFKNQDVGIVRVQSFTGTVPGGSVDVAVEKGSRADFHERVVRIGVLAGDAVEISYVLTSDASGTADGWVIDDIELVAESVPGETVLADTFGDASRWTLVPTWQVSGGRLLAGGSTLADNLRASATLREPLDLSEMRGAVAKIDVVQGNLEDGADVLHWEYSLDAVSWRPLVSMTGNLATGGRTVDLGPAIGEPFVHLRFRVATSVTGRSDGVTLDNLRVLGARATLTLPVVRIGAPLDDVVIPVDASAPVVVRLTATASDAEDGNLTARIVWSDDSGVLGSGGTLNLTTSTGRRVITASVVDLDGGGGSDTVSFTVFDDCPADPAKVEPGSCDCGVADLDADGDGVVGCLEACDGDPDKTTVGVCGCGVPDDDTDLDTFADCVDGCPVDPAKGSPGACGCGVVDLDGDGDGTAACLETCDGDPDKVEPGVCGCGVPDDDTDLDLTFDCDDLCETDPDKTAAGVCGCGVPDDDTDGDGTPDCNDACFEDATRIAPGVCGCGVSDADGDTDGTPDCVDGCPADPQKLVPGTCGCGVSDADADLDTTPDCVDGCPGDPQKLVPGTCGCGVSDADADLDTTPDCVDGCPADPDKTVPGACGCAIRDVDANTNGLADCLEGEDAGPDLSEPLSLGGGCACAADGGAGPDTALGAALAALGLGLARRRRARS